MSYESNHCPGCDDELTVSANGYCASCWVDRFGCEDLSPISHYSDEDYYIDSVIRIQTWWRSVKRISTITDSRVQAKMIDFISIGYSLDEQEMLEDAYRAIEKANMWEYMKGEPGGGAGYTFTDDEELRAINRYIEYTGHSGGSFAWVMRTMQNIAKLGEEKFSEECLALTKNVRKGTVNGKLDDLTPR